MEKVEVSAMGFLFKLSRENIFFQGACCLPFPGWLSVALIILLPVSQQLG